MSLALARTGQARRALHWLFDDFIGEAGAHGPALAAARERLHSGAMANRNPVAIVGIGIFLMVGVVVAVSIAATILLFLYNIVVAVFRSAFGIELPHLY
jgi:hypothetical protein